MNHRFLITLALAAICLLGACGGNDGEHGHPHRDAAPAPQAVDSFVGDETDQEHPHGGDTPSHDAPETEAFYGDDATKPTQDVVADDNGHAHGDDTHTHDGDAERPDSPTEHGEDENSVEPHGHDH